MLSFITDTTVMTVPAPGAGLSVLHTLNMLEGYSLKQNDPKTVHRMVEVSHMSNITGLYTCRIITHIK